MTELNRLLARCHDKVCLFDFEGTKVPCVMLDEQHYYHILSRTAGNPLSIDTNLNILQDGLGHVFVEVTMTFSMGGISEKILINANKHLDFFEFLADTLMLALSSPKSSYGKDNVFMIQLPRKDRVEDALDLIRKGINSGND